MEWIQQIFGDRRQRDVEVEARAETSLDSFLSSPPLIDFDALPHVAQQFAASYASAEPYPHVLIEDFLSVEAVSRILAGFPGPEEEISWRRIKSKSNSGELVQHNKLGMPLYEEMPPVVRELMWELNSGTFLRFLEKLTGISGLIADPGLRGGGIHQVLSGGFLGVHADFTNHAEYRLDRRLNVLLYLNRSWKDEYGGELELWARDMSQCVRRIRPLASRCVVFNTSENSFHGHPRPLACPQDVTRKSVAAYYYTHGRDGRDVPPTKQTDWRSLPSVDMPDLE